MKVLIDHFSPFSFAHGGFQIQIEQTKSALEKVGIDVDYLKWWDGLQRCDLIHCFGVPGSTYLEQARQLNIPVCITTLFTAACNYTNTKLFTQGVFKQLLLKLPIGSGIKHQLYWKAFKNSSHNIIGIEAERNVLQRVYNVSPENVSCVPLGLSDAYLNVHAPSRSESHLICNGTITSRKNSVELALLALEAKTPILFVGKPYHSTDPYWLKFKKLIDGKTVKHHAHVDTETEMIALLQSARGYVMMSDCENWCLSAHEAAACGLPLLVQRQNWSEERFGNSVSYFQDIAITKRNVETLQRFYNDCPRLSAPSVPLHSWNEVALQLKAIYEKLLHA